MLRSVLPVMFLFLALSAGFEVAVRAQPVGLSRPPIPGQETPHDLDSFAKARAKAKARIDLQEKRVAAAGEDAGKRARAVLELAQQHWDLGDLCQSESLSGLLEKALEEAASKDESLVLELTSRQTEVTQCIAASRQSAVDLLAELVGDGASPAALDESLFYLAWYEFQMERKKEGMGHARRLLKEFPESPFAPEGWLLVGEFNFELSAIEKAVEAYQKVTADRKNRLYPFALYKLAWCHFNLAEYEPALKELVEVVEVARESPHWESLAREAADSLPYFYAEIGKPAAALEFFRKVDSGREERLTAKLALLYSDQGKLNESMSLCKTLLGEFPKSPKTLGYRLLIVKNQGARGDTSALVSEFEALAEVAAGADSGLLEQARAEVTLWIEQFTRENSPAREGLIRRLKAVQQRLAP